MLRNGRGFSLIEALVSLAIAAVFIPSLLGWLYPRHDSTSPQARLYAAGLLEDQVGKIIEERKIPPLPLEEKDLQGIEWTVFYTQEKKGSETCVRGLAVRLHRDTVYSMAGCFHE